MKNRFFAFFALLVFLFNPLYSQEQNDVENKDTVSTEDKKALENLSDARQALKFGIDTTVIGVISQARSGKDLRVKTEIANLINSPNMDIRIAIMDYFTAIEDWNTIEKDIVKLVNTYEDITNNKVLVRAIKFLSASKIKPDKELSKSLQDILEFTEKDRQVAAIEAFGNLDIPDASNILKKLFDKPGTDDDLRKSIIESLGKRKQADLAEWYRELISDTSEAKEIRRSALTALGQLADKKSLTVISTAMTSTDVFERSAAINALDAYNIKDVEDLIFQGLRDSYWRNRLHLVESINTKKWTQFKDALIYLAEKDPEKPVRTSAVQAIVDFETEWDLLNKWLISTKTSTELKLTIVSSASKSKLNNITLGLKELLEIELKKTASILLESIARDIANSDLTDTSIYELLLSSDKTAIKAYAIRGIQKNKIDQLRPQLQKMLETNKDTNLKSSIEEALKL